MKLKRIETPKVVKVSVANHTKAAKLVKNKTDTFNDIFGRSLNVYEAFPKIRDKINNLYNFQLNAFRGNDSRRKQIETERSEFLEFLRMLEQ